MKASIFIRFLLCCSSIAHAVVRETAYRHAHKRFSKAYQKDRAAKKKYDLAKIDHAKALMVFYRSRDLQGAMRIDDDDRIASNHLFYARYQLGVAIAALELAEENVKKTRCVIKRAEQKIDACRRSSRIFF